MSETPAKKELFDPSDPTVARLASGYEEQMVPMLFGPWAEDLVDRLVVRSGEEALDVACGTGAVTRVLARRVGPDGRVLGVDLSPPMLAQARALGLPGVELQEGNAMALPVGDAEFDVAVCQQGLQFVPDPSLALAEMARATRPGGRLGVSCWDGPHENMMAASIGAAAEAAGWQQAAEGYARAFSGGGIERMEVLLKSAGFEAIDVGRQEKVAIMPDLPGWLLDFMQGPPFGADYAAADDSTRARFMSDVVELMERFSRGATHEVPWVATVAVAVKPS